MALRKQLGINVYENGRYLNEKRNEYQISNSEYALRLIAQGTEGISLKRFQRLLALLFSVLLTAVLNVSALAVTSTDFIDVPPGSWYSDAVEWAVEHGITAGTSTTTFSPEKTCSNAEVLTFLWRTCGQPTPGIVNPFTNVGANDYYYDAAVWAYEQGMVSGKHFQADTPCTREMAVTYLWIEAGSPAALLNAQFTDVNDDYAQAVAWAIDMGITNGTSETAFSPEVICTRAQIITFLYRDFAELLENAPETGEDVEGNPTPTTDTPENGTDDSPSIIVEA